MDVSGIVHCRHAISCSCAGVAMSDTSSASPFFTPPMRPRRARSADASADKHLSKDKFAHLVRERGDGVKSADHWSHHTWAPTGCNLATMLAYGHTIIPCHDAVKKK